MPTYSCRSCRYFRLSDAPDATFGECRRRAPVRVAGYHGHISSDWPSVNAHQWCGEYERTEDRPAPEPAFQRFAVPLDTTPSKPADSPQED